MLLSVYLGLFNLFPLPALDGGRLVFLGYEMVTRRRANPEDRGDGPHGRDHGARRRDDPRDAARLPRLVQLGAKLAAVIAADVLDRIPTEPGVYLFKDARGDGGLRRQGAEPAHARAPVLPRGRRRAVLRRGGVPRTRGDGRRDDRGVVVEGGAAPREPPDQEASAEVQRQAARRQAVPRAAARRSEARRARAREARRCSRASRSCATSATTARTTSARITRRRARARRCARSTATSSSARAPTTCSRRAAGRACSTRSSAARDRARSTCTPAAYAEQVEDVKMFLGGKNAELVDAPARRA